MGKAISLEMILEVSCPSSVMIPLIGKPLPDSPTFELINSDLACMLHNVIDRDDLDILLIDQEHSHSLRITEYLNVLKMQHKEFEGPATQFGDFLRAFLEV